MPTTPPAAAGLPLLPVPQVPGQRSFDPNEGPVTFTAGHHFSLAGDIDLNELAASAAAPLSVIVQVTKRCDFGCVFCSETLMMPDPYRTGQQLYPRPGPRLAAFAVESSPVRGSVITTAAAIVYLPLHRTRPVTVTGPTLAFGFRAASITGQAEAGALAGLADLDLSQARRHAAILTGCALSRALADLQMLAGITLRGLSAVQEEWAGRHAPVKGRAAMFDCPADLPGHPFLEDACQRACLAAGPGYLPTGLGEAAAAGMLAALMVERALIMALVCARHLGRYRWDGTLNAGDIMAAGTWDCLP